MPLRSIAALVAAHGEAARPRAERGVRQVAKLWREEDGNAAAFESFVQQHFAPDQARRVAMFRRLDGLHEQMDGSLLGMLLAFRWQTDLDLGPVEPYDELFAGYDPFAHVNDDFFANKIAFVVLLNFPLEPFDIWYSGFRPRGAYTEAQLDEITRRKYPTADAFAADLPNILTGLGFTAERAKYLSERIAVDPARGAGHAWGAARRGDKARLRTRVGKEGMDYKGYNIAVHELGHNVEQTFSLYDVPFHGLNGVPNTAFTEALAFVFQDRDLELLGLSKPDATTDAYGVLDDFWGALEISGMALVDMRVWRWMYAHPEATPAELREATLQIARDVWNEYFATVFGRRDIVLLAVYSHMISSGLYLPDYPIGIMIALQIKQQVQRKGDLGGEFERMSRQGRLTPDLWMERATGAPVGPAALLAATEEALAIAKGR